MLIGALRSLTIALRGLPRSCPPTEHRPRRPASPPNALCAGLRAAARRSPRCGMRAGRCRRRARQLPRKLPAAAHAHRCQRADHADAAGSPPAPPPPAGRQGDAARFFDRYFETARVGDGSAFATGYYEPEIAGSAHAIAGLRRAGLWPAARSRPRLARRHAAEPSAPAARRSAATTRAASSCPITTAPRSRRRARRATGWRSPGRPIRSSSSSSRSRDRAACARPTDRSCGSAMPGRTGATTSASAR